MSTISHREITKLHLITLFHSILTFVTCLEVNDLINCRIELVKGCIIRDAAKLLIS